MQERWDSRVSRMAIIPEGMPGRGRLKKGSRRRTLQAIWTSVSCDLVLNSRTLPHSILQVLTDRNACVYQRTRTIKQPPTTSLM